MNGTLSIFQNWRVGTVALIDLILTIGGIILAFNKDWCIYGCMSFSIGILLITYGWRRFEIEPFENGVLTSFGQIITTKNGIGHGRIGTITIEGIVIIFPPFLDVVRISMQSVVWNFDKVVLSVENNTNTNGDPIQVPLVGKISLTVRPDKEAMYEFFKAGQMKNIEKQMSGIIHREIQRLITVLYEPTNPHKVGLSAIAIAQYGQTISEELEHSINGIHNKPEIVNGNGILEQKSFGIELLKAQVDFHVSKRVADSMENCLQIVYENEARLTEYRGDIAAAKNISEELGISDLQKAMDIAIELRLLRDNKIRRIQI